MTEYGTLFSSDGAIIFRVSDGKVIKSRSDWIDEPMPTRVDVAEWQRTYPGEDVSIGHDILDFGLWYGETYFPPEADFRKERGSTYGRQVLSESDNAAK